MPSRHLLRQPDQAGESQTSQARFRRRFLVATMVVAVVAAVVFLAYPGIDLWAARHFYLPGSGFHWSRTAISDWTRNGFRLAYGATIATAVLGLVASVYAWRRPLGLDFARSLYLLACLAVGPGLIANLILKDHWGRARPVQVTEFGGKARFTQPLVPASECPRNCAFVSGEASNLYAMFFAPAFLFPAWRAALLAAGVVGGLAAGLMRMAQGGHFLSDVIFAGVFMAVTAIMLHWLMFSVRPNWFAEGGPLHTRLLALVQRRAA